MSSAMSELRVYRERQTTPSNLADDMDFMYTYTYYNIVLYMRTGVVYLCIICGRHAVHFTY